MNSSLRLISLLFLFCCFNAYVLLGECVAPTVTNATGTSGTYTLTAYTSNPPAGASHIWYTSATGSETLSGIVVQNTGTSPVIATSYTANFSATTTYWVSTHTSDCESARSAITFTLNAGGGGPGGGGTNLPTCDNTHPVPTVTTGASVCPGNSVTFTAHGAPTGATYLWYSDPKGSPIQGGTDTYTTSALNASLTLYVSYVEACESIKVPATATVYPKPAAPEIVISNGHGPVTLSVKSPANENKYQWYEVVSGSYALVYEGLYYNVLIEPNKNRTFVLGYTNINGCSSNYSQPVTTNVTDVPPSIVTNNIVKEGVINEEDISTLAIGDKQQSISYLDGFGRVIQSVTTQGSPSKSDLIRVFEYDNMGRTPQDYLPFTLGNDGSYKTDALTQQLSFYQTADKVAHDNSPYSQTSYEASPIGRVLEQGSVGSTWQVKGNLGKTTKFDYSLAIGDDVITWEIDPITNWPVSFGTNYRAYSLKAVITTNEDGIELQQYTDNKGRVILKRVPSNDGFADTYYIYDNLGNLMFTFPPQMVRDMGRSNTPTADQLNKWAYQYQYDDQQHLIGKKVPGIEWTYNIYDKWNRLVLTQDGNQRARNEWVYVKYDVLNRVIYKGTVIITGTRTDIQKQVDDFYSIATNPRFESKGQAMLGYTNNTFPNGSILQTAPNNGKSDLLVVNYYDDYSTFFSSFSDHEFVQDYNFIKYQGFSATVSSKTIGFLIASRIKVFGEDIWLPTLIHHDEKGRVIQKVMSNYLGGINRITLEYSFDGKVIKSQLNHSGGQNLIELEEYEYDHMGRAVKTWSTVNTGARTLLSQNSYNELGQLVDKQIGVKNNVPLQSLDYRYNIRGWLTNINQSNLGNGSGNDDSDNSDLFGMELLYEQPLGLNGLDK